MNLGAGIGAHAPAGLAQHQGMEEVGEVQVGPVTGRLVAFFAEAVVVAGLEPRRLGSGDDRRGGGVQGHLQVRPALPHRPVAEQPRVRGRVVLLAAVVTGPGIVLDIDQIAGEPAVPQGGVQDPILPEPGAVVSREGGVAPLHHHPSVHLLPRVDVVNRLRVHVAAHRQPADSAQIRRHLGVQILEEVRKVPLGDSHPVECPRQGVDPGPAAVHQVRHVLIERPLDGEPRGREAQGAGCPHPVPGTVPGRDVDGTRQRPDGKSVAASPRNETRPLHHLRVDRRNEAAQVERVEEPHAVEQHRRAVARAAPDEGHRHVVRGRGRGRRERGRAQHVRLKDRREAPQQDGIDDEGVPGHRQRVSRPAARNRLEALQAERRGRQQDAYRAGGCGLVGVGPDGVAVCGHLDAQRPGGRHSRHHERAEAVRES